MTQSADQQANTWALFCHLAAFGGYIVPFGHILGPLIIWLIKKDEYAIVDDQGKESLNFQISMTIYFIIAGILCLVLIGFVLLPVLVIGGIILVVIGATQAYKGEYYRYPFTIRFIK